MMYQVLFSMLVLSSSGCTLSFPNGITVSYTISDEIVSFEYNIPPSIYEKWDWVGLGLKHQEDGHSMVNGDYVSIIIKDTLIEDRTGGVRNGRPKTDDLVGGVDSLFNKTMQMSQDKTLSFYWDRGLNTLDSVDVVLYVGSPYFLQWAVGEVSNGVLKHHVDKGFASFILGQCDDSASFLEIN